MTGKTDYPASDPSVSENRRVARAARIMSLATLASRILGALRDVVFASFFGAGMVSDAFIAAFRMPNLLRRLFGEGSLSIAFVPVFTDCLHIRGRSEADRLAVSAFHLLAIIMVILTLAGIVMAPGIIRLIAPGFTKAPAQYELAIRLARIMMPYMFFISLVALSMGILNVLGHFAAPAFAPVLLNISMITAMLLSSLTTPAGYARIAWLAAGVVVGGALQLGLQLPFLYKHRFHFWRYRGLSHPYMKRVLSLMGPVMFGAAVYQINSLVITLLATLLPQGSVSYLYFADRLVQLPLGLFALSTATAVLPTFSRQVATGQWESLQITFSKAVQIVLFITIPAMVGLIVLRTPIIALLFQRGAFDAQSTRLTAGALLYYGIGLWSFAAIRIVINLFFALKDTRTPMKMAGISIAANIFFGILLMGPMKHNGLALALSLASMVNLSLLVWALRRRLREWRWRPILVSAMKSCFCAALMGIGTWTLARYLLPIGKNDSFRLVVGLVICMTAGIAIFGTAAFVMRLPELTAVMPMIRKKAL